MCGIVGIVSRPPTRATPSSEQLIAGLDAALAARPEVLNVAAHAAQVDGLLHGLPGVSLSTPRKRLSQEERMALKEAVESLSAMVDATRNGEETPTRYAPFVQACLQQTDNIKPRETRFKVLYGSAFG